LENTGSELFKAADAAYRIPVNGGWYAVEWTILNWTDSGFAPRVTQVLRELFGNPFRPVTLEPAWLAWNGGTVPKLAQEIHDERRLPEGTLDNTGLAVLADALEEAGCKNADILDHCRTPGKHVLGCWVVDLLLGKG
jgi:hypothetical protein